MKLYNSPQLVQQIKIALDQFIEKANLRQETFYNTSNNRQVLFDYLRKEKVSEDQWTDPHLFALAFFHCNSAGLLETRPVEIPETPEERALRLEAQDRFENSEANQVRARRNEPTIEEKIRTDMQAMKDTIAARQEEAEKAAAKAAEKAARDADLTIVPTVEWLQENGELPSEKVWAFSREQTRAYVRRLEQAKLNNQIARSEERRQKAREINAV